MITPWTSFTIVVPVQLSAATTVGIRGSNGEYGIAEAYLGITIPPSTEGAGEVVQYVFRSVIAAHQYGGFPVLYEPQSVSFDGTFTLNIVNPTDSALSAP